MEYSFTVKYGQMVNQTVGCQELQVAAQAHVIHAVLVSESQDADTGIASPEPLYVPIVCVEQQG